MQSKKTDNFIRIGDIHVAPAAAALLKDALAGDLETILAGDIGQPLDKPGLQSWRRRSRLTLTDETGQTRVFYLKRFVRPPLLAQIERLRLGSLRHGTAWIEWRNIRRLVAAGVPTMRPIAFAETMAGPRESGSLLCTEQVAGEALERWLPAQWNAAVAKFGFAWRKRFVEDLAATVRRLHGANLCHRDLYTSHIFVAIGADGTVRFSLIDLQRMFRVRLRRRRWWIKDLAALAASAPAGLISRTDRLRFLRVYLGADRADKSVRRWWRAIEAKAGRMMRHHAARMRRLTTAPDAPPSS